MTKKPKQALVAPASYGVAPPELQESMVSCHQQAICKAGSAHSQPSARSSESLNRPVMAAIAGEALDVGSDDDWSELNIAGSD